MADRKGSLSSRLAAAAVAVAVAPSPPLTNSKRTASAPSTAPAPSDMRTQAPYGTRSRGRNSRVNYAEDKDNEMDFELSSSYNPAPPSSKPGDATASASARRQQAAPSEAPLAGKDPKGGKDASQSVQPATASTAAGRKRKGGAAAAAAAQAAVSLVTKDVSLSNMLSFDSPFLKDGKLISDDGTVFEVHDHIYLVCEPPGEPYYLARIMEFVHTKKDASQSIDMIRVNWYYRPKDINRKDPDTRVLFASMHSDTCPLSSIRGKCYIKHRSEIENLDEYRKRRDSFYFERMFDRYIQRYYDVIPSTLVRNVPEAIRKALVERWRFLLVEPQRGKELCSQMKECKRCSVYCSSTDSVHCAVCGSTYHMNCVRPPLLKKPSRGFAWACAPCSRAQERKLEARNTLPQANPRCDTMEEDVFDDEEDELSPGTGVGTETPSEKAAMDAKTQDPTLEQLAVAQMWQMRYLGQHCHVEDALDYDDRIYPRAGSRLGSRHQATVPPWPGRPVEYIKPPEKKKTKGGSKGKQQAEAEAAAREKRPKWIVEEPAGYVERGLDDGTTSTLLFRIPVDGHGAEAERERETHSATIDRFLASTKKIADKLNVPQNATNFLDKALEILHANSFNEKKSLEQLAKVQARDLKEPRFRPDEVKRFEEGVAKYGSELHAVTKHVKTRRGAEIVRFYYQWKKTPRGREIWGNYEGRRGKKEAKLKDKGVAVSKLVDDVADDEDDSAFDVEKAAGKKRGFECKFCGDRHSRQWRRAPGVAPGTVITVEKSSGSKRKHSEATEYISALCRRCAELWRRYGIRWEDPDEVQKKMSQGGGRGGKKRIDEELLKELNAAQQDARAEAVALAVSTATSVTPQPPSSGTVTPDEPPKKRLKAEHAHATRKEKAKARGREKEKEKEEAVEGKKEEIPKAPEKVKEPPPPPPEPPKPKVAACGVCGCVEEIGRQHASCRDCKMTVHKRCYGVGEMRSANKWVCEMCTNDRNPTVSTNYECVLCPEHQDPDAEPEKNNPYHKSSYKKKAAQERVIKESPEVDGRKVKEVDKHKPQAPREPLKKTSGNYWAHVICAVWTPEVKFSDPKTMRVVEGIGTIPMQRYQQVCKVCKVDNGATIQCTGCRADVHVHCANISGWRMGFDIQPVKGSKKDSPNVVKIGNETGIMTACLWCPEHEIKTRIHRINEIAEGTDLTALELFLQTYKQADLSLTGTVRKANLVSISSGSGRSNSRNGLAGSGKEGADSTSAVIIKDGDKEVVGGEEGLLDDHVGGDKPKKCMQCQVDVSPLWWKVPLPTTNGAACLESQVNGDATPHRSQARGLMCSRCHKNDKVTPPLAFGVSPNGIARAPESKFTPLPPLHVFLAQQHQVAAIRQQQQLAQQQAPQPVPVQLPPPASAPPPPAAMRMPEPSATQSPQRLPVHSYMAPTPPQTTPQHRAPPPPHISTPMPVHQMSRPPPMTHSPHHHHSLPPHHLGHNGYSHHNSHANQNGHPNGLPLHLNPPVLPPRHPIHLSPPTGHPRMMPMHPQMGMHRSSPTGHPTMMQQQGSSLPHIGHQPQHLPHQPPPPPEEPRRVLSGASGSPALANLLS